MRVGKKVSGFLLSMLLLLDAVVAYRFFDQGWPRHVKVGSGDTVQVARVPFTWGDGLIVLGIAALHVLLIHAFRKSRTAQIRS
jgi:hypothetical protein